MPEKTKKKKKAEYDYKIKKQLDRWFIYSKDGKKILGGPYSSESNAEKSASTKWLLESSKRLLSEIGVDSKKSPKVKKKKIKKKFDYSKPIGETEKMLMSEEEKREKKKKESEQWIKKKKKKKRKDGAKIVREYLDEED